MKLNKIESTNNILTLGTVMNCTKKSLANIVWPLWNKGSIQYAMFRQNIRTKEQPEGHIYDEAEFRLVWRVLGGKLFHHGMLDAYAWDMKTFQKYADKAVPFGTHSAHGIINLGKILETIVDEHEKELFAAYIAKEAEDLLLVYTPAEARKCIEVTQELYDAGITHCVNEWEKPDENGMAATTELKVGDYLIVTNDGVYCVRHDEFVETYSL